MSRMTSKGQVTVPKKIRDYLGLKPGAEVEFEYVGDGRIALKPGEDFEKRVQREQARLQKALAGLRSIADVEMTTDEVMRLTRGWGEPDYETSLRPVQAPASASDEPHTRYERKRHKRKAGA